MKEKIQELAQMVEMEETLIEIQDKMNLKKIYLELKINLDQEPIQSLSQFPVIVAIFNNHSLKKQEILILKDRLTFKIMHIKYLKILKKL